jgi:hypothetical protein
MPTTTTTTVPRRWTAGWMIGFLMATTRTTLALSDIRASLLAFGSRPSSRRQGPFQFYSRHCRDWSSPSSARRPNKPKSMAPLASTTSTSSSSSSGDIGTTTTAATTVTTMPPNDFLGCTTESFDNYDVVKVDLENDRDYPIYIGTGYSDEQGMRRRL